jgi:hypothetical protein
MITLGDVLFKIAMRTHGFTGMNEHQAVEEFLRAYAFDITTTITSDVEQAEVLFLEKYGFGQTLYFRLSDLTHGRALETQLSQFFVGNKHDRQDEAAELVSGESLYLVVYVKDRNRQPGKMQNRILSSPENIGDGTDLQ